MSKKYIITIIPIIIIIILGYVYFSAPEIDTEPIILSEKKEVKDTEVTEVENAIIYDDVSLPAFAQKEFIGKDLVMGRVLAQDSLYTRYYITYSSNGLKISGIMNVPTQADSAGKFPVLILNHGFIDPAIYTNGRGLKREQDYLAKQGYVVIHPDYRNHAESDKDDSVDLGFRLAYAEDVVNAINAVKNSDLEFFDKENIGMLGHSMGGGVGLQIMTTFPDIAKAYVLFAPVSADARDNFDKWIRRSRPAAKEILEKHGEPEDSPDFWNSISPNMYFDKITNPVQYHHGTIDESVPIEWSARAVEQMKSVGVDVEYNIYENEPHEFINAWSTVMKRTTDFFDENLK